MIARRADEPVARVEASVLESDGLPEATTERVGVPGALANNDDVHAPADAVNDNLYVRVVKRSIDVVVATVAIFVLVPVLLAVALAVRVALGHGVIFRQQRVGRGGQPFTIYKFRTMTGGAMIDLIGHHDPRARHKDPHDPRHTQTGRFLRRWSLDELPQLFNVVRGDMSLVGPRPELPEIVSGYEPWEHLRHTVRPGITGFWQTRARSDGPMYRYTHMDVAYVEQVSMKTDLQVLLATVPAIFGAQKGS